MMDTCEKTIERDYIEEWRLYKETKSIEARNDIVLKYIDLVKKIVSRFNGSYNNFGQLDDMVNQGIIALIDAVEKFDLNYNNKFETYATLKIRGAVIDFIRKQDWVPREQRSLSKELDAVYSELYSRNGYEPTRSEIAERMEISVRNLDRILEQKHNSIVLSYEETINEKMMIAMPITDNHHMNGSPEPELLYDELKAKLVEAIDHLNEKERLVVTLYYYENLKLKEIASILDVTESRVSQIHSSSIIKMKHILNKYQQS